MSALADHLELVRAPAVLSVLGDTLAGAAAAGHAPSARRALLPVASACLYAGGMALNDWSDRELDARERPERPVPSGRISPRRALGVAAGLLGAGVVLAAAGGGRRALVVAVPLAAAVCTYDTVAKDHPTGPVVMAACRGLDVLLGAGWGRLRRAAPAAAALAAHTAGVTVLSRGEVHGTTPATATAVAAGTAVVTGAAALAAVPVLRAARRPAVPGARGASGRGRAVAAGLATLGAAGAYAAACLPAQLDAGLVPSAERARTATRSGIRAMVPLQAAWTARGGDLVGVGVLAAVEVAGRALRAATARRGAGVSET